ncbi:carboxypeptidase M32 [Bacillus carboniphilus]|uniref:Metal-dependent carboxypeptidase n=1 Tax=Bacillus carboniphilus TaxID=86663 RepID=A0ABY9JWD1_9BACI|nr:carboxypeptidase M32 [Bacillus carboniphilus]WLR43690.1 carboxypeptidase M32 [Bacillus carboniphilus]
MEATEQKFLSFIQKMQSYNEAISLMFWDLRTGAPKKAVEGRSQVIGNLSSEVFEMSTSEEMESYITELIKPENFETLSEVTQKSLVECKKEFDRNKKIPAEEYKEYVILQSKAEAVWEEAKEKSDFSLFAPFLQKLVEFNQKFVEYWGYEGNKYNTLLDIYEPGITVDILDDVFHQLRERIVPLVHKISEAKAPKTDFLFETFSKEKQREFSMQILKQLGYDFEAGRLDETVHPFAISLNRQDVRITTKYDENDFRTSVFGTIHECGHAVYEQNISEKLEGTPLADGTSMGIHESQSLFFENFIGRHYGFWKKNYQLFKEYAPKAFTDVSLDDYYKAINESKPSLIRIEADELTYPLHIMIRYEIEKALINGEVAVENLPKIWNEKYEEYLGVTPKNDAEGVLQDVHWSGGSFGYFPSYALGYMYAAQFKHKMLEDLPNYDELMENGDYIKVKEWLTNNIHQFGKLKKPLEILQDVTGESLNAQFLIDYLEDKYSRIYGL